MKGRYVLLGANPRLVRSVNKKINQKLQLKVYDVDQIIVESNSKEASLERIETLMEEENLIMMTTYNRILSTSSNQFETLIFLDFSYVRLLMSCLIRFDFKGIKTVSHYYRVKRPWIINKINQFGTEKNVIVLTNPRQLTKYMKRLG